MENTNEKSGAVIDAVVDEKVNARVEILNKRIEDLKLKLATAKDELNKLTGKKSSKSTEPKDPGVIETILEIVEKANIEKGVSKKAILSKLVAKVPDRAPDGMSKTINVQLPTRMSRERGIAIEKLENGNFYVKTKVAKKVTKAA
jgi:hypothetical protein